jgi:hypothetical protein
MVRALATVCCLALLALAGCGSDEEEQPAAPSALADLTVTVDRDGDGSAAPKEARVRCESAGDSAACRAAAGLDPADLDPVPRRTACTQQFGGPQTATIQGTLHGEDVDARLSRTNGCEISRWKTAQALLEAAG